jgi:hypothetical protein
MVLDQLIAEAEATLRQRELQQEEVRQAAERKHAETVEKARNSLIAWLSDLLSTQLPNPRMKTTASERIKDDGGKTDVVGFDCRG